MICLLSESPVHDMSMNILASYFVITWLTAQLKMLYGLKPFSISNIFDKTVISCDPVPLDTPATTRCTNCWSVVVNYPQTTYHFVKTRQVSSVFA